MVVPKSIEIGNQTTEEINITIDNCIQTEGEQSGDELAIRLEVGNQTELSEGGRGEVPHVGNMTRFDYNKNDINPVFSEPAIVSYETPADTARNQHPIVSPDELLQALQALAMQQGMQSLQWLQVALLFYYIVCVFKMQAVIFKTYLCLL